MLTAGRAVRVANPPSSMTPNERQFLFHNGECVAGWALQARLRATQSIRTRSPDFIAHPVSTRLREAEMGELANRAQVWTKNVRVHQMSK